VQISFGQRTTMIQDTHYNHQLQLIKLSTITYKTNY